jgi:hypothetical protein
VDVNGIYKKYRFLLELQHFFFFLQFAPGDSGSWIHTLKLRIMVGGHTTMAYCPHVMLLVTV